jgi:ribonuclease BN (tRNA processing enzyme)
MRTTIIPLGTSGWIPTEKRETMCFALKTKNSLVLLDAGTGIKRFWLLNVKKLIDEYREINILLSHFHLEHIFGLTFIPQFFRNKHVRIIGPGECLSGFKTRDVLTNLFKSPVFALPISNFPMELEIADFIVGENIFGDLVIEATKQKHSDSSAGLRVNGDICYVTDTICSPSTITFAKNAKVLIHECWFDNIEYEEIKDTKDRLKLESHAFVTGVAQIALKAKVNLLALTHLNPEYPEERYRKMLKDAKKIFPNTIIPNDLKTFEV